MKRLIVSGLIIFLLIMIATFPARIAYTMFAPAEIQLSGISGSIWNGTATEGIAAGAYVRNIAWKLKPVSLFSGELAFTTSSNPMSGTLNSDLAVSPNGTLTLSNVSGNLPLDLVHPALQQNGIRGDIEINFDALIVRNGVPVEAAGTITVTDFHAANLSASRIGDFLATFSSDDGTIVGEVSDLNGVLELAGSITLTPDRSFAFIGQVAATGNAPQSINNQLQFLGSADDEGLREFRFEGQL